MSLQLTVLSFSINRNEIFGLLGPNGAGKTTTISILVRAFSTYQRKSFDRRKRPELQNCPLLKTLVGIVPQDIALYPTLTARENLEFYGSMYGLHGKDLKNKIESWLAKTGI